MAVIEIDDPHNYVDTGDLSSVSKWIESRLLRSGMDVVVTSFQSVESAAKGMLSWSPDDSIHADSQGWGLFDCDGERQLQRSDESEVFSTDDEAADFVNRRAGEGDDLAKKAISLLIQEGSSDIKRYSLHLPADDNGNTVGINKETQKEMQVLISCKVLSTLIDMANSQIEDIESGIEDGTYLEEDNDGLGDNKAAVETAEMICRSAVLS